MNVMIGMLGTFVSLFGLVLCQIMIANDATLSVVNSPPFPKPDRDGRKRKGDDEERGRPAPPRREAVPRMPEIDQAAGFAAVVLLVASLLTGEFWNTVAILAVVFVVVPAINRFLAWTLNDQPLATARKLCWEGLLLSVAILVFG